MNPYISEFGGRTYPTVAHWSRAAAGEPPPRLFWASIVIAKVHRADNLASGNEWICPCRTCDVVRQQLAREAA